MLCTYQVDAFGELLEGGSPMVRSRQVQGEPTARRF
jgi:hypothetical protein